jgi:hypothetical protein
MCAPSFGDDQLTSVGHQSDPLAEPNPPASTDRRRHLLAETVGFTVIFSRRRRLEREDGGWLPRCFLKDVHAGPSSTAA